VFGGIAARGKILVIADAVQRGEVIVFDLEDARIVSRFHFPGVDGAWPEAGGIALAADSSVWIADAAAHAVRRFSLFGHEVGRIGLVAGAQPRDRRELVVHPRAVCVDGRQRLWVACGDRPWVHGLQVFAPDGSFVLSAAAFGDRARTFGPASGLCCLGEQVFVADTGNDHVQCLRDDGGFVGAWPLPSPWSRPIAVAAWAEGRAVLVQEPSPQVLVFDRHFARGTPLAVGIAERLRHPSGLVAHGEDLLVLDSDATRVMRLGGGGRCDVVFDRAEWDAD
jgi:hypothetical protein